MTANNIGLNTVESSTTETIRKPVSKTSEHRRVSYSVLFWLKNFILILSLFVFLIIKLDNQTDNGKETSCSYQQ